MKFEIVSFPNTWLIGMDHKCSFVKYDVYNLWKNFMPRKSEIQNQLNANIFSIAFYPENFFGSFNPNVEFVKVAAIQCSEIVEIPTGMKTFEIPEGMYFKFRYKGKADQYPTLFERILKEVLPQNNLVLDNRPHFEILGPEYKNNDPNSEEDIHIPVT